MSNCAGKKMREAGETVERGQMNAALIVFNSMTALDFVGFYDPVTRLKRMEIMPQFRWTICARTPTVTDDRGLTFVADSVGESLAAYDLLFVPGGIGTRALQTDAAFLEWLRSFPSTQLATSRMYGRIAAGSGGVPGGEAGNDACHGAKRAHAILCHRGAGPHRRRGECGDRRWGRLLHRSRPAHR
ncbi:MAG: hypothetical protein LZF86_190464 [Nitrospira sp.]|nr:MAG: hypothetical protein LZF86_190464 [Nitrospira sp.]